MENLQLVPGEGLKSIDEIKSQEFEVHTLDTILEALFSGKIPTREMYIEGPQEILEVLNPTKPKGVILEISCKNDKVIVVEGNDTTMGTTTYIFSHYKDGTLYP